MYNEKTYDDSIAMNNSALIRQIGEFIKHHRIRQNKTQKDLSNHSGVKIITLSRIENGCPFNIMTLIQLLRSLNLLEIVMDTFKFDNPISPSMYMKMQGKIPKRIRHSKKI